MEDEDLFFVSAVLLENYGVLLFLRDTSGSFFLQERFKSFDLLKPLGVIWCDVSETIILDFQLLNLGKKFVKAVGEVHSDLLFLGLALMLNNLDFVLALSQFALQFLNLGLKVVYAIII